MKYRLKADASVIKHDGKTYGPGDKIDLTKEQATLLAHHLENGEALRSPARADKELDEPE